MLGSILTGGWRKEPMGSQSERTQTKSNQIKPNQTCRRVESDEKGRRNTGRSKPVKPQKEN
jgi:hypothetical protein